MLAKKANDVDGIRFLYLSFIFPPLAGAESRYNLSLIRGLYKKGFLPTVITAPRDYPYPKDEYLKKLIPEKIEIRRADRLHLFNRSVGNIITRINRRYQLSKHINSARELIRIPPNPLLFSGWRSLYEAARTETISESYKFIYSVHGIGAAHLSALKLKRETGLPWITEFRDPWFHNFLVRKQMKDKSWKWWYVYQLKKTKKLLAKVLKYADLVVVEAPMHGELLVKDFGVERDKIAPYGMGYDEDYFSQDQNSLAIFPKKPVIGFVGSVYYGYENMVRNFVLALRELEKKQYDFTFVSVGDASSLFSKYAEEVKLRSFMPIGRVSLFNALSLMKKVDFGVVCAMSEHKSNISSKIWDYLRYEISILAIVPEEGAMARIINDGKCGYILPEDVKSMLSVLERALMDYKKGEILRPNLGFVAQFSRENMVDKLAKKIEQIIY